MNRMLIIFFYLWYIVSGYIIITYLVGKKIIKSELNRNDWIFAMLFWPVILFYHSVLKNLQKTYIFIKKEA